MSDNYRFKGVYPALVTPFDENGVNDRVAPPLGGVGTE